ncbi:hypothetical protein FLW53_09430 [Microbispora sp. SCL1-1]|uniref:hypothetical protein n=1 Tax=unclassified Microbispora TaxID=2614687 RepID=UPI001156E59C|nr:MULTISPECIES: hypothetical protein [unclassified Microbispora]NJP24423.1 hypothetical protein [Microbispora sp. CL1-1]TQS14573.1 hypothetical protein FLW53_09430 [Microbispora sp. SCL1-1]
MAGSFAKIYNRIWADADFRSLTRNQQWLYFTLISQPELTFAGVVTTTDRRLTGCAVDFTAPELKADLAVLHERRYVVVDHEHDEILVRTYIKWDDAWKIPNVLKSIIRDASMVRSQAIRATLAEEFARLPVAGLSGKKADEMRESIGRVIETLRPMVPVRVSPTLPGTVPGTPGEPLAEPFQQPSGEPIGQPSVVVAVVGEEVKDRTSVEPGNDPAAPAEADASGDGVLIHLEAAQKKPTFQPGSDQDPAFVAFWKAYPRKVDKGHARAAWVKAVKRADPQAIVAAAERFRDNPMRQARGIEYTPHPTTWLNGERWNDETATSNDDHWRWDAVQEVAPREFNHR